MHCPACQHPLTQKEIFTVDSVKVIIHECQNCGGHYLPPLVANYISPKVAQILEHVTPSKQTPIATKPTCPYCHENLASVSDTYSKKKVQIFVCPNNHGHFFPANQLKAFIQTKHQKVDYHEIWGIPTKAIASIVVPVATLFTLIAVTPIALVQVGLIQETRIQAGDIITKPLITPISSTQVIVTFRTKQPAITTLNLTTPANIYNITGESSPQVEHLYTLDTLEAATAYSFTVTSGELTSLTHRFKTTD